MKSRYWERIGRTRNLANSSDPDKRRAERHRLYMATKHKKYLDQKKPLKVKHIRRAYKIAKREIDKQARAMKRREPHLHLKNLRASIEAVYFQEDQFPTHFRSDVEAEDLP